MKKRNFILSAVFALMPLAASAGDEVVPIKYGDMNSWVLRNIHESGVIGGHTKTLYEVGPSQTLTGNNPYKNLGHSPWGTSNVMAKVMGVVKTNNSVYRDKRGSGYCAKLTTHVETCKVLGDRKSVV